MRKQCNILLALFGLILIQQVYAASENSNKPNTATSASPSSNSQAPKVTASSDTTHSNNHNNHHHNLPPPPTRPVIDRSGWRELPRPLPANSNFYTLSSVQRRKHTFRFQTPKEQKNKRASDGSPAPIGKLDKIMIPIGVSHYKPIQFVDASKLKRGDFSRIPPPIRETSVRSNSKRENVPQTERRRIELPPMLPRPPPVGSSESSIPNRSSSNQSNNKRSTESSNGDNKKNTNESNSSAENSSEDKINKIESVEEFDNSLNNGGIQTEHGFIHKPRMIELESSYIPLTLRFSTRPRRLNIIHHDDLIGQDSNRFDRINGRVDPTQPIDILDPHSGISNLDTRAIFGQARKEEPIVLRQGSTSRIPSNMQSIIKCVFPDFRFEGFEKVRSAC